MKLIVESNSLNETRKLQKYQEVDIITVGLDFLSLENKSQDMSKLEKNVQLIHHHNKKIALDVQRIFHEDDFLFIKILFNNPCIKKIDYFIYSDLGIYQLLSEFGLAHKTIYRAPTYLTNEGDINIYQKLNAYVVGSNQITWEELEKIVLKVKTNLIIDAFGMGCCFYSRRPLLTNYLKFKELKNNGYTNTILKLQEETRSSSYHFIEDDNGTRIYEDKHYALTNELNKVPTIPYIFLHHFNVSCSLYLKIVSLYNDFLVGEIDEETLDKELSKQKLELGKGVYNQKTVLLKGDGQNE